MGFINLNTHGTAALHKSFINIVSSVVVAPASATTDLIAHNPFFAAEVHSFLDGKTSHHILVDIDDLVLLKDLGFWQDCLIVHINRIAANGEVPVLEDWLSDQDLDELVDVSHLLVWIDTADGEAVTHTRASSNAVRYSINTAEFRWKMDHIFAVFDDDQRLIHVCDVLIVDHLHVLGHTDLLIVINKHLVYRISFIVDIADLVSAFVTPISNYR